MDVSEQLLQEELKKSQQEKELVQQRARLYLADEQLLQSVTSVQQLANMETELEQALERVRARKVRILKFNCSWIQSITHHFSWLSVTLLSVQERFAESSTMLWFCRVTWAAHIRPLMLCKDSNTNSWEIVISRWLSRVVATSYLHSTSTLAHYWIQHGLLNNQLLCE